MQNPLVVAPNGAICCKLGPNSFLGWGLKFWGQPLALGQPLRPRGKPFAPGATPSPKGQPLCPRAWGNPFALGATPLPLGQSFKKWFLKVLWELPGGFLVAQGTLWELVRFWTPFSEKICHNQHILHGLGAGEGALLRSSGSCGSSGSSGSAGNEPRLSLQTLGSPRLRSG